MNRNAAADLDKLSTLGLRHTSPMVATPSDFRESSAVPRTAFPIDFTASREDVRASMPICNPMLSTIDLKSASFWVGERSFFERIHRLGFKKYTPRIIDGY